MTRSYTASLNCRLGLINCLEQTKMCVLAVAMVQHFVSYCASLMSSQRIAARPGCIVHCMYSWSDSDQDQRRIVHRNHQSAIISIDAIPILPVQGFVPPFVRTASVQSKRLQHTTGEWLEAFCEI